MLNVHLPVKSWVPVPASSDFSLQNIPFGICRTSDGEVSACTAIGESVLLLAPLYEHGLLSTVGIATNVFAKNVLNAFFKLGRTTIGATRLRLIELLSESDRELQPDKELQAKVLLPLREVQMLLPVDIRNYTDFYSSEEHARNVGSMFRDPANALLPNWKHLPVGYHGRASSIVVSGTPIHRPKGQIKLPESVTPTFGPSHKLDFELETGFVTCAETKLGESISTATAFEHIAGMVLFNDWSARDIQQWEYVPLGPFLGKNFGSSMSPWVITLDALEPFRVDGTVQDPPVLPYLRFDGASNYDVTLEAILETSDGDQVVMSRTNMRYLYWNVRQQLAHHTVNGCNIEVGDVYASGTISGPSPGSYGSLLELTWNGKKPLSLPDGTGRTFLQDHDTVILRGHAEKDGIRIGFGECRGQILPAR